MDIYSISIVIVLIALTAFFVAAEFAIVKVRSSRIDNLIAEGNNRATSVKTVITNLDEYLSACQLGITVTALGIGWFGKPALKQIFDTLFANWNISTQLADIFAVILVFLLITFLHVVIGELAPKTVAIQKSEQVSLLVSKPLIFFYHIAFPFIWLLNGSARIITKLLGLKPPKGHDEVHSEEELRLLVSESYKNGEINQSEYKYVNKIFEFDDRIAKEIMVPRTEMNIISKEMPAEEALQKMSREKYTRYPVVDGDKDHVIGFVNFKDIFTEFVQHKAVNKKTVEQYVRPIILVIDSIPIHDLFLKMQKERTHIAILIDEYGGTSGLVTVEDILEEIVGDIQDEFDTDEQPEIQQVSETKTILEGKVLVSEVNTLFGLAIDDDGVDTIGGWILTKNIEIAEEDSIEIENYKFCVKELDGRYIKRLEVTKTVESIVVLEDEKQISLQEQISS
ncbi:hemolysin family protein [Bacillus toyonensis]|uniref:HlyC/CorC family transporter n=1 Tax=Bacillus toyonensis TaxID=155322 RepID=A0A2C4ECN3_9BACI|nr:hemolysin family protein [Bacillus toyonensis]OQD31922.1 Hemolysin C [Bacillus toyonensis]PDZ83586.1 HlyC/CorC family transporter [Bacillus toyonensis]PEA73548.1 HlyC/CorC family transporter [Bacillus toyonensis]PEJ19251.1 HlyC/CorC family transporter [Bacillus toyonensis]PEJ83880.1 HlyC/CorC family transporter [Bacillus toyonensis]